MKKYITSIIFALAFTLNLSAQNDGFFSSDYTDYREEVVFEWGTMPALPEQHGGLCDYSAVPLGSGLLLLGGLALAYGLHKKNS